MLKMETNNIFDEFNFSYSAYSTFKESPYLFFLQYIMRLEPQNDTADAYGCAGNVIHTMAERIIEKGEEFSREMFEEEWKIKDVDNKKDINGNLGRLNKEKYFKMAGVMNLKIQEMRKRFVKIETEVEFINNIPGLKGAEDVNFKGYVDVVCQDKEGNIYLYDWKTNSKSTYEMHHHQRMMYAWLFWKVLGKIPKSCIWEYLSLQKMQSDVPTIDTLKDFEDEMIDTISIIRSNGYDSFAYELGNVDTPFNAYKMLCHERAMLRDSARIIQIEIRNNKIYFDESLPKDLADIISKKYRYKKKMYNRFKGFHSEEKIFFVNDTLPLGFLRSLQILVKDYSQHRKQYFELQIFDCRNSKIMNKRFNTVFKESDIELRYYQNVAVKKAIEECHGILYHCTGAGKTVTATEIIRNLNRRTLFLVNQIELANQTQSNLEKHLGVDIGLMTNGNLVVDKQITVSSVQTIVAILNRNDDDSKLLRKYLANISCCIYDECQNLNDEGMYGYVTDTLLNCKYLISLSGSPYRNDGTTMSMKALTGDIIHTVLEKELEDAGFLVPTICYFVENKSNCESKSGKYYKNHDGDNEEDFSSRFSNTLKEATLNNVGRNEMILNIVDRFSKDKKVLVLCRFKEHTESLAKTYGAGFIHSGVNGDIRNKIFDDFRLCKSGVLFGGNKIFGEGIDIPDLDIVINCVGNKSQTGTIQMCGRVKRKTESKNISYYIDFMDYGNKYLEKFARKRVEYLKERGNEIKYLDVSNVMKDGRL